MCKVIHNFTIINYKVIARQANVNHIITKQIDILPVNPYNLCHAKVYQHEVRICYYHRYISHVSVCFYFFNYIRIWYSTRHYHKIYASYRTDLVKCRTCYHRYYDLTTLSLQDNKTHQSHQYIDYHQCDDY